MITKQLACQQIGFKWIHVWNAEKNGDHQKGIEAEKEKMASAKRFNKRQSNEILYEL